MQKHQHVTPLAFTYFRYMLRLLTLYRFKMGIALESKEATPSCGKMLLVTMLQVISYYHDWRDDIASN